MPGQTSTPLSPRERPPNPEFNASLFDDVILQMIINPSNYGVCRDIFAERPLTERLARIPPLDDDARAEYEQLARTWRMVFAPDERPDYDPSEDVLETQVENGQTLTWSVEEVDDGAAAPPVFAGFDENQLGLLAAFHHVRSWNYCERNKIEGTAQVSARWFPLDRDIVFYHGYCEAGSLYDIEISHVAASHRALFTAAHEFGHVLERLSRETNGTRLSRRERERQQEVEASYLGSYVAQCGARLIKSMADWTNVRAQTHPAATPLDREFYQCQARQLDQLDEFFLDVRREIEASGEAPRSFREFATEVRQSTRSSQGEFQR